MKHEWPHYKEKCAHCGKDRVFYKSVPQACPCQYKELKIKLEKLKHEKEDAIQDF